MNEHFALVMIHLPYVFSFFGEHMLLRLGRVLSSAAVHVFPGKVVALHDDARHAFDDVLVSHRACVVLLLRITVITSKSIPLRQVLGQRGHQYRI